MRCLTAGLLLSLLAVVGCGTPGPVASVRWAPSGNLLLSRSPHVNTLAMQTTQRPAWPAVENGFSFENVTTTTVFEYDDQFFRDSLGGTFYRTSETIRTGVQIR